jgi:predicted dehydrogenase
MSGVIHTVNAVHGMLDRMGIHPGEVVGGHIWSGGESAAGTISLLDGRAAWHFAQVLVPDIAWYRERYVLHFDDTVIEMEFPAPYLNNQQTDLWVRRTDGLRLDTTHVQAGYGEAFVRELEGFHASIVDGEPVRNTVEDAMRDARLLTAVARHAIGNGG